VSEGGRAGEDSVWRAAISNLMPYVDRYITPRPGRVKLAQLTKARVMAFRDDLVDTLPSRSLAKKVLGSLKGILSEARDRGRVAINAASGVKVGNGSRGREEVIIPEIVDIRAILAKADELAGKSNAWQRWRVLIATAVHTGLRASELRGLPWDEVDLKAGKINVVQKADENGAIGKPKSKSGYRTINIPATLKGILLEWKLKTGGQGLVFGNGAGNPESLANIFNRAWKPVQIAAGVANRRNKGGKPILDPRYNFHTLRHFHASMLIADGANPKDIQVEMGHASIQITFDLYGHKFKDEAADQRSRERAERVAQNLYD